MDQVGVGAYGDEPEGEVLRAHRRRQEAVARGGEKLRTSGERRPRHFALRMR